MQCALRHAVTTLIAVILPFFGDLLGFIGAIATGPTTFWLPPLMWLILKRPSISNVKPSLPLLLRGPMHASAAIPPCLRLLFTSTALRSCNAASLHCTVPMQVLLFHVLCTEPLETVRILIVWKFRPRIVYKAIFPFSVLAPQSWCNCGPGADTHHSVVFLPGVWHYGDHPRLHWRHAGHHRCRHRCAAGPALALLYMLMLRIADWGE